MPDDKMQRNVDAQRITRSQALFLSKFPLLYGSNPFAAAFLGCLSVFVDAGRTVVGAAFGEFDAGCGGNSEGSLSSSRPPKSLANHIINPSEKFQCNQMNRVVCRSLHTGENSIREHS